MIEPSTLMGFDLFKGLREEELIEIAPLCHQHTYEKDALIFTAGSSSTEIYLLEAGTVAIQIESIIDEHETKIVICTVQKGQTFGWTALVPPHTFTASAQCLEKADVTTVNAADLMIILKHHNFIGNTIMTNLSATISSRLACTTAALRNEIQKLARR
jgi:CRP/FNR family transcriptional regulator, cyclic AMP receptor protein